MIIAELKGKIEEILIDLGVPAPTVHLEHPVELSHGDYATNVAMAAFVGRKKFEKALEADASVINVKYGVEITSPLKLAEKIKFELDKELPSGIEKVEIAGPGFINFTLSKDFFAEAIPAILKEGSEFGKVEILKGKKVLVEHSSPNLFKPFHIGHMMNNAIGESLVRLMQFSGAEVVTMSFPSDISLGVAKAIFILLEKHGESFTPSNITILGDAYVEGTKRYEEDESVHVRVKEIADNLYAGTNSPELIVFELCKKFNIEYFEGVTAKLGSRFDSYIYESEAGIVGSEIVRKYTPGVFTESEGAIVYIPEESKKHLNAGVFINSQGNPTYEAKDIGLLKLKFDRVNPDVSIFITDYQQIPHFDLVLDAAEKIEPVWSERSKHIPHGRMSFKGQKMSSRLGGVPLATEMIEQVLEEVAERTKDRELIDAKEDAESIAIGAIKFAVLRTKPGQNINFDPETSLSFEGDSGPYLQYTHARIQSLIEKGKGLGFEPKYKVDEIISNLEKVLYRFPEVVELAINEYAPQYITTYIVEIARAFNSFYGEHMIVDENNKEVTEHRLALARATQIVIKNGLHLLGIKTPEKM